LLETSCWGVAGVVPNHIREGRDDLVGIFSGGNIILETSLVHPARGQASSLDRRWLVDLRGSIGRVDGQSVSCATHLSSIPRAWRVAGGLVCRESCSVVQKVVTETLDTIFQACNCVSEACATCLASFGSVSHVVRLLEVQITSGQAINVAASVNPARGCSRSGC
jgi:hypothetical protein